MASSPNTVSWASSQSLGKVPEPFDSQNTVSQLHRHASRPCTILCHLDLFSAGLHQIYGFERCIWTPAAHLSLWLLLLCRDQMLLGSESGQFYLGMEDPSPVTGLPKYHLFTLLSLLINHPR